MVYDEAALKIAVWYDYQKVIELNLPSPIDFGAARYYVFGNGGDSQPFDGWIDELRVWRRPIDVSEFLYAEGRPGMLMMLR